MPPLDAKHAVAMRRRAETRLRQRKPGSAIPTSTADSMRLVHELQVHQIELEMQNAELQDAREQTEILLEKYTDLYDFAPVGYFSLDELSRIHEVNLTGASLLGTERSRLLNQRLSHRLTPASQADFHDFLRRVYTGSGKQACEVAVVKSDDSVFWASLHGTLPISAAGAPRTCRVVVSDLTAIKQAEEAQHRLEALAASIRIFEQEIAKHRATEGSYKKTSRQQSLLLARSRLMQERLRQLSYQMMSAHDDEHRQVSKELYAVISQALSSISIQIETIKREAALGTKDLGSTFNSMRRMVDDSLGLVDRFSRKFHPTVLDDLGLIPAVHSHVQAFAKRTRLDIQLDAFPEVEQLSLERKTALYNVILQALSQVVRDKHASQARIIIDRMEGGARLRIVDNGSSSRHSARSRATGSIGLELLGMQERMVMVGGTCTVESNKGGGTTLTACVPFGATARAKGRRPGRVQPGTPNTVA